MDYKHPLLKELLAETYGVMIYQEDVLKVGHYFAGLDLADADVLRRMMGHKMRDKSEFEQVTKRFFNNCKASFSPRFSFTSFRKSKASASLLLRISRV